MPAGGIPWGVGAEGGAPSLSAFMVQLDQRFLTQLAHTAAHFAQLFPGAPRKQLLKVRLTERSLRGAAQRYMLPDLASSKRLLGGMAVPSV